MSVSQVLSCRHFCNKMWQTVRFTLGSLPDTGAPPTPLAEVERKEFSPVFGLNVQCPVSRMIASLSGNVSVV